MEIFTTRCLSLSQVILVAHSDSFPSSIWLMGAGEIEQDIVPLPSVSTQPPPTAYPDVPYFPGKTLRKKWGTLETRLTQMSQLQPSQLLYTALQRVGRMWHFLRAYYVSSPTPALLVYEFTGDRMWQLVLVRFNCQLDTFSICQEINTQWGTAFLRLLCGHVWRCFKLTDVGSPNSLWAVPLPRGPEHYC